MSEIIFNSTVSPQRAEFTGGTLSRSEYDLINAVITWDRPERYKDLIYQVHGRSINFASPNKPAETFDSITQGKFSGLQIIGAGGSMQAVRNGFVFQGENFITSPSDPTNHAKALYEITQLRRIDEYGDLILSHRSYAPLHGMDSHEAHARKTITAHLGGLLAEYPNPLFVVPKLTAEGIFPDKVDIFGDPLHFQVYRVPILDRAPAQFFKIFFQQGEEEAITFLSKLSFSSGRATRFMNEYNLAYMDGHPGNMSLATSGDKMMLYATDLGSAEDISKTRYKDRYRGLDNYMYFESLSPLLKMYGKMLEKDGIAPDEARQRALYLYNCAISGAMEGYFSPELQAKITKETPFDEIKQLVRIKRNGLLTGLNKSKDSQEFIEFFEQYFRQF